MMDEPALERLKGLSALIGNSPLLKIEFEFRGRRRSIYAKAENFNMTGSIKDRMAYHIIEKAYSMKLLRPGNIIAEATSGNTGIAFSALGRALGHPVVVFMPDWMSRERIDLISGLGAQVRVVSRDEGGFLGSIRLAEELAASRSDVFLPRQFSNEDNSEAHFGTTGPEIWSQLALRSVIPDAFVAGVGTGGTIMGVARFLRKKRPGLKVHPLEPASSPTLSTGHKVGKHRIQGIMDEFIPPIVDLAALDHVVAVDDGDAILMAQKLASELGIGVGISSGANLVGAIMVQQEMGWEAEVVTVFPDDNKKYLSTDLLRDEPVKPGYMAPHIRLLSVRAFKRTCQTCCA